MLEAANIIDEILRLVIWLIQRQRPLVSVLSALQKSSQAIQSYPNG